MDLATPAVSDQVPHRSGYPHAVHRHQHRQCWPDQRILRSECICATVQARRRHDAARLSGAGSNAEVVILPMREAMCANSMTSPTFAATICRRQPPAVRRGLGARSPALAGRRPFRLCRGSTPHAVSHQQQCVHRTASRCGRHRSMPG